MGSERINALSKVAQNVNVHPFQPCLPLSHSLEPFLLQVKEYLTSISLTSMRVSFVFSSMCKGERHKMGDPAFWEWRGKSRNRNFFLRE